MNVRPEMTAFMWTHHEMMEISQDCHISLASSQFAQRRGTRSLHSCVWAFFSDSWRCQEGSGMCTFRLHWRISDVCNLFCIQLKSSTKSLEKKALSYHQKWSSFNKIDSPVRLHIYSAQIIYREIILWILTSHKKNYINDCHILNFISFVLQNFKNLKNISRISRNKC